MKKKYLLCIALSSCFVYIRAAENHASFVLSKAQEQFGTKMSLDQYEELEIRLIKENTINDNSFDNKFYCNSKNGNTLLVYTDTKLAGANGYFDIIRLKEKTLNKLKKEKSFKEFSFPVIASLKGWSKNSGLKIPKPLIDTILQYGYKNYDFDYDSSRGMHTYVANTLQKKFPAYQCYSLFVDDQKNIVINFKDKDDNNIIYIQAKDYTQGLIVPEKVNSGDYLIINSEICKPGEINIKNVETKKNKRMFTLKATKNDTLYTVDL